MAAKIKKTNNVLVTGSKGFIGSHLMKALGERGFNYDIKKSTAFNINNPMTLKAMILATKPSTIVHLAAISNRKDVDRDPELALRTNIIGTFNVLTLAKKYGIRVILASSAATYEPELSLYGTTKECMEQLAVMFDNAVIMRFYNVYGKGSKSVVNIFTKRIRLRKPVYLNGNTTRDYIYIDDVIGAIMRIIEATEPEKVIEVGTGRGVTLRKLVSIIGKATGNPTWSIELAPIKEIQESQCHNTFHNFYKTTLEQGVRRLLI